MAVLEIGKATAGWKESDDDLVIEFHTEAAVAAGGTPDYKSGDVDIEEMHVQSVGVKDGKVIVEFDCGQKPWYIIIDAATLKAMNKVARAAGMKS